MRSSLCRKLVTDVSGQPIGSTLKCQAVREKTDLMYIWYMFVHASLYKRREENQLDDTECFIALIICSTLSHNFPHPGRIACCSAPNSRPPATKALHTICSNNPSIVSSSWWWAYKCPKHVEQFISAIKHSVASSWFSSFRLKFRRTVWHLKMRRIGYPETSVISINLRCVTTQKREDLISYD